MTKPQVTVDDIDVLEEAEGTRKNIYIFFGEESEQVFQALREGVENVIDLFIKGQNRCLSVVVQDSEEGQDYTIIDHGPGIPIETHPKSGISTLTTVLTKLNSGSNFRKEHETGVKSRGKHGMGISVTNAVSSKFVAWTCRGKKWYKQSFSCGKAETDVHVSGFPRGMDEFGADKKKGTIIKFRPDYTVLPRTILQDAFLRKWLKTMASLNPGLKIRLVHPETSVDEEFVDDSGILSILKENLSSISEDKLIGKPFLFTGENVDVALQWTQTMGETVSSYINGSETPDGGTHVQGLHEALAHVFKTNNAKKVDFNPSDIKEGLIVAIHYRCSDDKYLEQKKSRFTSGSAVSKVRLEVKDALQEWTDKNAKTVTTILARASKIRAANIEANNIRKIAAGLKPVSNPKVSLVPTDKLIMCSSRCPIEDRELFIVEGNSAGGVAKEARETFNHIILKIRGKTLNVGKTSSLAKILANEEIKNLLLTIGADLKNFNSDSTVEDFKVGKIFILNDPDVDGYHIRVLLLTVLWRFAPKAFERGMIYIVKPPLYQGEDKKGVKHFAHDFDSIIKKVGVGSHVTRFKGLGEFNAEQLRPFAFVPETRVIERVLPLLPEQEQEFWGIVGKDTQARKILLGVNE